MTDHPSRGETAATTPVADAEIMAATGSDLYGETLSDHPYSSPAGREPAAAAPAETMSSGSTPTPTDVMSNRPRPRSG